MTIVDKNGTMHIWVDFSASPVVEAARGSGQVHLYLTAGSYSTEDADDIAAAISKATRYAKEDRDDEKEGD